MKNGLIGIIFLLAWVVACSKDKGDQSSPSITINHPTEGSTVGSNFSMVATISDENLKQYWISLTTKSNNTPLFVQNESFASIETLELNIPFIVNGFTEKTALVLTIIAEDHAGNPKSEQTLEFFFEP